MDLTKDFSHIAASSLQSWGDFKNLPPSQKKFLINGWPRILDVLTNTWEGLKARKSHETCYIQRTTHGADVFYFNFQGSNSGHVTAEKLCEILMMWDPDKVITNYGLETIYEKS